tara:strand:+ start:602 stop:1126 length:525 start_codon:yes stop_codon:yes gene_type:complete
MNKKNEPKKEKKSKISEIEQLQGKIQELTELLQRTQADSENYRKQTEKRIQDINQFAAKSIIIQILPILDNFELALKNTGANQKDFTKGVELIYSQLFTVLENQGVKTIQTENQEFNPYYHEALMKINSEKQENTIIEELQKGFMMNDKVIRPAKVKVSDGQEIKNNNEKEVSE